MKRILFLLLSLISFSAFAQPGSLKQSGYFTRVLDTATYQTQAATAHAQGYSDMYWNEQATTPHMDIWNGSSYDHVFDFNAGGGGTPTLQQVITAGSVLTGDQTITSGDRLDVTLTDGGSFGSGTTKIDIDAFGNLDLQYGAIELNGDPGSSGLYVSTGGWGTPVVNGINNGAVTTSPSQDAVFDALALKAPLASPALTGTPTAPTAAPGTNTTQIATTAFVADAVGGGGAVSSVFTRTGAVTAQTGDYTVAQVTGAAPLTLTLNVQTADYTLQLSDQTTSTEVVMNVGIANNLTVPPNASVAFPTGTQILVRQTGAGLTTFVQGAGVTITSSSGGLTMPGQNYSALLIKTGTNTWSLDNGSPALVTSDITTALGYTPWATTGTTTVNTPTITQDLAGSGTTKFLTFNAAAHTGQTASTELIDIDYNLARTVTFATGALTTQRAFTVRPPTYAFAGASTITNAYAFNITGPPVAGTNATITNRYSLGVASTTSSFNVSATLANFSKFGGTGLVIQNGSIVLSNSTADPTLTNTIQVGTVSNVNSITSASSSNPITYSSLAHTQTSGAFIPHRFTAGIGPTSGTASYKYLAIDGTTNQTGGANGNVTILAVEPTWTAAGGIPTGIDYNPTGTPANHVALRIRPTDAVSGFATGATAPNSTVQVNGSFSTAYVAKTGAYTLTSLDYTVEVTSGTHTQTLPTAVGITGRTYVITNSGTGVVTLATTSSQTFVNVTATPTTLTLNQFETATVQSNGANWLRL